MDINKLAKDIQLAIDTLRSEQQEIDAKIAAMEDALKSLGEGAPVVRRGRPKKVVAAKSARTRKRPHWSDEAREAARARMKKYWEDRKKGKAATKATKKKATKRKAATKKKRAVKRSAAAAASE